MSDLYTITHRPLRCPNPECSAVSTKIVAKEIPTPGTPTICLHCLKFLVYEDCPNKRLMTEDEWDALDASMRTALRALKQRLTISRNKVL